MGCGVNGCLNKKSNHSAQPIPRRRALFSPGSDPIYARDDTIVEGVCLREANAGHYFAEAELFGNNVSNAALRQLEYRLDKWWAMCTYGRPPALASIYYILNLIVGEDPEARQQWVVAGLKEEDAEFSLTKYAQREPHVFHRRLVKGPPPVYRWVAWKVALKVKEHRVPGLYAELKQQKKGAKWLKTIQKDLDRTFPSHPLFGETSFKEKGQIALENILTAFSIYSPNVGYCQGMNFVVGFLLIMSGFKEEDTFWTFASLMRNKVPSDPIQVNGLEGLYYDNFPLLRVLQTLFMALLAKLTPVVKEHIERTEIPEVLWLHKWLSTLFLYSLPVPHCIRIWDYVFATGSSGLLKVGAAILRHLKQDLLASDFSGCCELFKTLKEGHGLPPPEKLITAAEKISVDWTAMENLRKQVVLRIEEEEVERLNNLKQEEAKRLQMQENSGTPSRSQHRKESDSGDDQRGKRAEDNSPNIYLLKHRRTKQKRGLRKTRLSNKAFMMVKAEESVKLPPIVSGAKKEFVFESFNDVFFSDEGNVQSEDNNDLPDSTSFVLEATKKNAGRRKSTNARMLRCSKSTMDLRTSNPKYKTKVEEVKVEEKKEPEPTLEVVSPRVFSVNPAKCVIKLEEIPKTDRALEKVHDKLPVVVSQSFDDQERGGKVTQILC